MEVRKRKEKAFLDLKGAFGGAILVKERLFLDQFFALIARLLQGEPQEKRSAVFCSDLEEEIGGLRGEHQIGLAATSSNDASDES